MPIAPAPVLTPITQAIHEGALTRPELKYFMQRSEMYDTRIIDGEVQIKLA